MRDKNRAMKRMWKQWDYCLNLCELYELVHPPRPIYISQSTDCRQSFSCNCRHVSTLNGYKTANKTGKSKATCPHQRRTFLIYGPLSVGWGGVCSVQQLSATALWTYVCLYAGATFTWASRFPSFQRSHLRNGPDPCPPSTSSSLRLRGSTIYHDTNEHEIGQGLLNFPFKMRTCQGIEGQEEQVE